MEEPIAWHSGRSGPRPTALTLNILVAALTVYRFRQARFFSWAGLWPFLLGSVPFAALGGIQSLSRGTYYVAISPRTSAS